MAPPGRDRIHGLPTQRSILPHPVVILPAPYFPTDLPFLFRRDFASNCLASKEFDVWPEARVLTTWPEGRRRAPGGFLAGGCLVEGAWSGWIFRRPDNAADTSAPTIARRQVASWRQREFVWCQTPPATAAPSRDSLSTPACSRRHVRVSGSLCAPKPAVLPASRPSACESPAPPSRARRNCHALAACSGPTGARRSSPRSSPSTPGLCGSLPPSAPASTASPPV